MTSYFDRHVDPHHNPHEVFQHEDRDWSLEALCNFSQGVYRPRNGLKDIVGDKCEISFNRGFTYVDAFTFCENNIPYHTETNGTTSSITCKAEATLICKSGWVQFEGRCYQMEKTLMNFVEAEYHCSQKNSKMAYLYQDALTWWWYRYFTHVPKIWLRGGPPNELIYSNGPDLMLVYDGFSYGVPTNSLFHVDGEIEKAMVLCEYDPPMTPAELARISKKLAKYDFYYPSIITKEGIFVRSASQRTYEKDDADYCRKVVGPWMPSGEFGGEISVVPALPTEKFLDELDELVGEKTDLNVTFYRTPVHFNNVSRRNHYDCQQEIDADHKFSYGNFTVEDGSWGENEPRVICDGASFSTAIRGTENLTNFKLNTFSDARSAPIWCQIKFGEDEYTDWIEAAQDKIDVKSVNLKADKMEIFNRWHQCFSQIMIPISDPETFWDNFMRISRECDAQSNVHQMGIVSLRNSDEMKHVIFPKNAYSTSHNLFSIGIGRDIKAEKQYRRKMIKLGHNVTFYGADPITDINEDLYSQIGTYFPLAIGSKSGVSNASVLKKDGYVEHKMVHIDIVYFFQTLLNISKIDNLWFDAEGEEFEDGFFDIFYENGRFDQNSIDICQFNIEIHIVSDRPNRKALFMEFVKRILAEKRFGIHFGFSYYYIRLFMFNYKSQYCLDKF